MIDARCGTFIIIRENLPKEGMQSIIAGELVVCLKVTRLSGIE